jgi:regulator of sirC expression with transglutaminase-like and TPR domain
MARAGNEALAKQVKPALVAIYPAGREGTEAGVGSGFVISADGLIVTNFHVIGEGRALRVEFPDGVSRAVTSIHASDRTRDLAVIRVAGEGLTHLELGDSAQVEQGTPAVVMGNPLGYRFSMVEGMISARQEVEGRPMLQLAMPVERGNSGGPLLDREGKVLGIVTLKSAVTANLGFAVPVNELKVLLEKPNPVAMKNWMTIGALNPKIWQVPESGSARWSQRAGVLQVRGTADGFGGRMVCAAVTPPPPVPYEISVRVKLGDEAGAAGLAFCSDGGEVHYGFYPTNGGLRFTKFEGADVSSWTILEQTVSPHYQSGEWNHLRVRVEAEKVICWLNQEMIFTSPDKALRSGAAGLCQFRGTSADFRDFKMGMDLSTAPAGAPPELSAALQALSTGTDNSNARAALATDPAAARSLAMAEAAALEKRASTLRQLAAEAAETATTRQLAKTIATDESSIPLAEAALLLAQLDNPELDPAPYLGEIGRMAADLRSVLTEAERASPAATLAALNRWLFAENGFHGSRDEFSNKSNSYLNEVIDDREGLPITLAVLHMELAQRLGLNVVGIPLPGRFITQLRLPDHPEGGPYIDVFDGGRLMNRQEASAMVRETTSTAPLESAFEPAKKRDILLRMLNNLSSEAVSAEDTTRLLRYSSAQIALEPDAINPRLQRFYLLNRAGRRSEARADATWLLDHRPPGSDESQLRQMLGDF